MLNRPHLVVLRIITQASRDCDCLCLLDQRTPQLEDRLSDLLTFGGTTTRHSSSLHNAAYQRSEASNASAGPLEPEVMRSNPLGFPLLVVPRQNGTAQGGE